MKTKTSKPQATLMTAEVLGMIALRHSAEQRGQFEPLGRLQWLRTDHCIIRFPAIEGEGCGPDLAFTLYEHEDEGGTVHSDALIVLGQWEGLPPLRVNTTESCPKCRHTCDVCGGAGKKLCELCGGKAWIAGNWLSCPGPGCSKETGQINAAGCNVCHNSGQVAEQNKCGMCDGVAVNGFTQMTCSRCKGTGKFSTGRLDGWDLEIAPKCKACDGTTYVGRWQRQAVSDFTNATLRAPAIKTRSAKTYLVLGPIREFAFSGPHDSRTHIFDVTPDAAGDLLVLLVPARSTQKPQKAYLVGGVLRERLDTARAS